MNTNEQSAKILIVCNCWIFLILWSFSVFGAILTKDFNPNIIHGAMLGMLFEMCLIGLILHELEGKEKEVNEHD